MPKRTHFTTWPTEFPDNDPRQSLHYSKLAPGLIFSSQESARSFLQRIDGRHLATEAISSKKKLFVCSCSMCAFRVQLDLLPDSHLFVIAEGTSLAHSSMCTSARHPTAEDVIKDDGVQQSFLGENTSYGVVRMAILRAFHFDASNDFIHTCKKALAQYLSVKFQEELDKLLPFIERLCDLNVSMKGVIWLEKTDASYVTCFIGTDVMPSLLRGTPLVGRVAGYSASLAGAKLVIVGVCWGWAQLVWSGMVPVLGLDAHFAKAGGVMTSHVSGRFGGTYIPIVSTWHSTEDEESHSFALRLALLAAPALITDTWVLISDRCKGLLAAFRNVVRPVNPNAHQYYDKVCMGPCRQLT